MQLALRQRGKAQHRLYRMLPGMFSDTMNYLARDGDVELWKIINLSPDTHLIHIHLIHFKLLARDTYAAVERVPELDATNDSAAGGYAIHFDPTADTIRVDPSELVVLAMPFRAYAATDTTPEQGSRLSMTGRYMYHCHILEYEDHEMMRPLVVMPPEVVDHMHAVGAARIAPSAEPATGWYMDMAMDMHGDTREGITG